MSVSVYFLYSNRQIIQPPAVPFGQAGAEKTGYSVFSVGLNIYH
jgi:hypothetical protein